MTRHQWQWVTCVNVKGLEGILEHGRSYQVRQLPCGAVRIRRSMLVCAGSRFEAIA